MKTKITQNTYNNPNTNNKAWFPGLFGSAGDGDGDGEGDGRGKESRETCSFHVVSLFACLP